MVALVTLSKPRLPWGYLMVFALSFGGERPVVGGAERESTLWQQIGIISPVQKNRFGVLHQ